jgi:molecular chaperone IbpA
MEDVAMRNLDLDPFWRSSVGFDRLFALLDESRRFEPEDHYPPYNIVRTDENAYQISLAVAGFKPEQLSVTVHEDTLIVTGQEAETGKKDYLYRGIAGRSFERRFSLADHVQVTNATLEDGVLRIDLVREVPEAMKPRRIEIGVNGGKGARETRKAIERDKAA